MNTVFEHNSIPGSLELAYLGDAVYDLYVRRELVKKGGRVQKMHREAITRVCASAQSEALGRIENDLTEAEAGVVRRARNAKQSVPKSATPGEYHRATAFEALLGFLYLLGRHDRLEEILTTANPDKENANA